MGSGHRPQIIKRLWGAPSAQMYWEIMFKADCTRKKHEIIEAFPKLQFLGKQPWI
jgi:hypothetical protein